MVRAKEWLATHRVTDCNLMDRNAKLVVPVNWLTRPTEQCARPVDESHVNTIYESLGKLGLQETRVVVVLWKDDLDNAKIDWQEPRFDVTDETPPVPFHVIMGLHTTLAVQRHNKRDPSAKQFRSLPCEVSIAEKSESALDYIRLTGTVDNTVKGITKKMTCWDCMYQIHNEISRIDKQYAHETEQKRRIRHTRYRESCSGSMGYSPHTMGTMFAIALQEDRVFDKLEKIFTGQVKPRRSKNNKITPFKVPASANNFRSMKIVPVDTVLVWLDFIIDGTETTNDFLCRCNKWRKEAWVTQAILEYINETLDSSTTYTSYDQAGKTFDFLNDPTWLERIVASCEDEKKKGIPRSTMKEIEKQCTMVLNANVSYIHIT